MYRRIARVIDELGLLIGTLARVLEHGYSFPWDSKMLRVFFCSLAVSVYSFLLLFVAFSHSCIIMFVVSLYFAVDFPNLYKFGCYCRCVCECV